MIFVFKTSVKTKIQIKKLKLLLLEKKTADTHTRVSRFAFKKSPPQYHKQ